MLGTLARGLSWPNYVDLRDRAASYESLACHQATGDTIVGLDKPEPLAIHHLHVVS